MRWNYIYPFLIVCVEYTIMWEDVTWGYQNPKVELGIAMRWFRCPWVLRSSVEYMHGSFRASSS
jgi:hypothetical protein